MGYTLDMASKNLKYIVGEYSFTSSSIIRYMALSSTKPNVNGGNVTEPTAPSYARTLLGATGSSSGFSGINHFAEPVPTDDGEGMKIVNNSEIHFNEALEDWGELKYFAIYDSLTGGTPIYIGELTEKIHPVVNTVPLIRVGKMEITLK